MHVSTIECEHRTLRRADSYWPWSIYRSINFSQVMNSLGAQLTAWRASLTAHSNFPFERMEEAVRLRGLFHSTGFNFLVWYQTQSWCNFWLANSDLLKKVGSRLISSTVSKIPVVRWFETTDATCISGSEPTCHPTMQQESIPKRASSIVCLYLSCL